MFMRLSLLVCAMAMLNSCVATAVVGGASAAGSAAFDERSVGRHFDDVTVASKVDARLVAEKDMPSRWVSVEVVDGVVTLTGYLPDEEKIRRAVFITRSVEGVKGVRNKLKVGEPTLGSLFSDSWITTQVKTKLLEDKVVNGVSVHVETVDGKVYLQGIVSEEVQRYRAVDLAKSVDGVTAVVDLLQVRK